MSKINVTNGQLEVILNSEIVKEMVKDKEIPAVLRWQLSRLVKEAAPLIESFVSIRDEIFQKYCNKYESDVYDVNEPDKIIHKKGESIIIEDEKGQKMLTFSGEQQELVDEVNSIATQEIILTVDRLKIDDKTAYKYLSATDMLLFELFSDFSFNE